MDSHRAAQYERVDAAAAVDRNLPAVIVYDVVAASGLDEVGAAAAVDRVAAGPADQHIGGAGAGEGERSRQRRSVHIFEVHYDGRAARRFVGARPHGEIERGNPAGGLEGQRVDPATAVDRDFRSVKIDGVVAGPGVDHIRAAGPVDRVIARAAGQQAGGRRADDPDARRQRGSIDILEVRDGRRIARGLIRGIGEVHVRGGEHHERVRARAAVDLRFRAVIIDRVVARSGMDRIRAALAVDRVAAPAAEDLVGEQRALDRNRLRRRECGGVDILEVGNEG